MRLSFTAVLLVVGVCVGSVASEYLDDSFVKSESRTHHSKNAQEAEGVSKGEDSSSSAATEEQMSEKTLKQRQQEREEVKDLNGVQEGVGGGETNQGGGVGKQQEDGEKQDTSPSPAPTSAGSNVHVWWVMLSRNHECSSEDVNLGEADSVEQCAERCHFFEGCQYFIFGHGDKQRQCWAEKTTDGCHGSASGSAGSGEQFVPNDYNFYQIKMTDVSNRRYYTADSSYSFYRVIVTAIHQQSANASFCIEDIIFYDGNNTPIDTNGRECNVEEIAIGGKPKYSCCLSTSALPGHSCESAFSRDKTDSWFCSATTMGFIGYQFADPTYVHSYAVHDVYGLHAMDPSVWTLQGSFDGTTWTVLDVAQNIPWVSDDGLYNSVVGGVSYNLIFRKAECSSEDIMLGVVSTVEQCAEACASIEGCLYFIFGTGEKAGHCYYELTTDGCDADGYPQRDDYDLFQIQITGQEGDGGESVGGVEHSIDPQQANCGTFFGSCSNVFLLFLLLLSLGGGIWLLRSLLRRRYARLSPGFEYDTTDEVDESEA